MIYKYMTAKWGLKFLETGKIRYSQFNALNDFYEGDVLLIDLLTYEQWSLFQSKNLDPNKFQSGLKEIVEDLLGSRISRFEALIVCENWLKKRRNQFGVLSMAKTPKSLPMWAHYGEDHRGILVGFDGNHSWFHEDGPSVRPVVYSAEVPEIVFSRLNGVDMWFSKCSQWGYEEEVRHVKMLEDRKVKGRDSFGHDVYLFDLPRDCVQEIICGIHSSEDTVNKVKRYSVQFPKASIRKAIISKNSYEISSVGIEPNLV